MALATLTTKAGDGITFEVSSDRVLTWRELRVSGEARWATHEVHLSTPVKEFLGPGSSTITLDVLFDVKFGVTPKDELEMLRALRDTGQVLQFIVGGELIGDFVIKGLGESWARFNKPGALLSAKGDITLEEYA